MFCLFSGWNPGGREETLWQIVCIEAPHPIFTGYQSVILTLILGGLYTTQIRDFNKQRLLIPSRRCQLWSGLIWRESVRCRARLNFLLLGQITFLYNEHYYQICTNKWKEEKYQFPAGGSQMKAYTGRMMYFSGANIVRIILS